MSASIQHLRTSFTLDDLRLLSNALNEVCNGVDIDDAEFATRLGCSREEARKLLQRFSRHLPETVD